MKLDQQFEDRIHRETWMKGHYCCRIPTGARVVGRGRMIAIKTPFDFAAGVRGKAVFFDAKTTAESTFNIGSLVMRVTKVHQFQQLREAARAGSIAGYMIWFYSLQYITWVPIEVMAKQGAISIRPTTPGCTSMEDNRIIDLAVLIGLEPNRPSALRGTFI